MTFSPNSKAPEIVRLFEQGLSQHEIARKLKCTQVNVSLAIKRHVGALTVIVTVADRRQVEWLKREARRCGVSEGVMARALLVDAISEAMEAEGKT